MKTAGAYVDSLRDRTIRLFIRGERIEQPVDHPLVAPSVRTVAESYRLAHDPAHADVFTAHSRFIDGPVNRFAHVFEHPDDLHKKQAMQRTLGALTGTCFQRCVGMDALNALFNVTHEMVAAGNAHADVHARFVAYLTRVQREDLMLCGAMTDAKGDRRQGPAAQPDKYLRVVERRDDAIVIRGAKLHQTGVVNSHEILVMPGRALGAGDEAFAVSCAVPLDAPGVTLVYGRSPSDERRFGPEIDQGNARYGGQEATVLFEDVVVPMDHVFMLGEVAWSLPLVEYFAGHHRHSYGGCKPGNNDVLIGAAALAAKLHGVERASHVRDKLVEMVHLNETLYACGVAAASRSSKTPAGTFMVDPLLANVCKHNVTRFPHEIGRLAEDLAGGLVATLPGDEDFAHPELGPALERALGTSTGSMETRRRTLRLIESMTVGTTATPLRAEATHGAGSPQAQRVRIASQAGLEEKIDHAKRIAGIDEALD